MRSETDSLRDFETLMLQGFENDKNKRLVMTYEYFTTPNILYYHLLSIILFLSC